MRQPAMFSSTHKAFKMPTEPYMHVTAKQVPRSNILLYTVISNIVKYSNIIPPM